MNFDEMLNRTRNMAEAFSEKSAKAIDVSRKRIELIDTTKKLEKAYAAFGRHQYNMLHGETVSESIMESTAEEIEELREKVKKLEDEIDFMLDVKGCPECGSKVKSDSVYCSACGANMGI